jgi:hypothetical protein
MLVTLRDKPLTDGRPLADELLSKTMRPQVPEELTGTVALLEQLLRTGHRGDRCRAARQLGRLGALARAALPALRQAARSPDKQLRTAARKAIRRMRSTAETQGQQNKRGNRLTRALSKFHRALLRALGVPSY